MSSSADTNTITNTNTNTTQYNSVRLNRNHSIYHSLSLTNYISTPSQLNHSNETQYNNINNTKSDMHKHDHYIQYNTNKTDSPNSMHMIDTTVNDTVQNNNNNNDDGVIFRNQLDDDVVRITYQHDHDADEHNNTQLPIIYSWNNLYVAVPIQHTINPIKSALIKILNVLGLPVPQVNNASVNPLIAQLHTDPSNNTLLQPCSGSVESGRLVVIMGSSGSGKTTLLNMLSGRGVNNDDASVSGSIHINNHTIFSASELQSQCSYITQYDYLHTQSTIYESIEFSARSRALNKNHNYNKYILNHRVNQLLQELDLLHCCHRQIGMTMNSSTSESQSAGTIDVNTGLSGGQIRRCSVGIELISDNRIILCDEITSGLDSSTAYNMIQLLKHITQQQNKLVVCTIHSPSNKLFHLFDDIILMCHGHVVYNGPINNILDWLSQLGYNKPDCINTAEYIIDLVKIENELDVARVKHILSARPGQYNQQSLLQHDRSHSVMNQSQPPPSKHNHNSMTFYSWLLQLQLLLTRELRSI